MNINKLFNNIADDESIKQQMQFPIGKMFSVESLDK